MTLQFPSSPSNNDVYENYIYNSTAGAWQKLPGNAFADAAVSDTPPVNPNNGDLWLNSADAKMYIYYNDGDSSQWIAAVGGTVPSQGKILQVVSTTKTDTFTTSSTSFVDVTGFTVSVTPSSATNKIFVIANFLTGIDSANDLVLVNLVRDSTNIAQSTGSGTANQTFAPWSNNANGSSTNGISFLDSPATTSATTYKIQVRANISGGVVTFGRYANNDLYRSASFLTVMEVAA